MREGKNHVAGYKQTLKLLEEGLIEEVFTARDADLYVTGEIEEIAKKQGVAITKVDSMKRLGKMAGIEIGAAVVGILK